MRIPVQEGDKVEEVRDYQVYVGLSSPYNFNGLVRHYFLRAASYQADIQVNLVGKGERRRQSHEIVKHLRTELAALGSQLGARVKLSEVPPGPPVLQTLVAEVYGPDAQARLEVARQVKHVFETTEGVSDVDWYMDDDQPTVRLAVDQEKAMRAGVDVERVGRLVQTALGGGQVGLLHDEAAREDVPVRVRLPIEQRATRSGLALIIGGAAGNLIDRIAAGYVVDFVDLYAGGWHFWTFNVADAAITVGVVLMILDLIGVIEDVRGRRLDPNSISATAFRDLDSIGSTFLGESASGQGVAQ